MPVEINKMPALVREFLSYKQSIQGCSPKTVEEYALDLRTFFRYIKATRMGLPTSGEEFDKIDISTLGASDITSVTPADIYEFFLYVDRVRGNGAGAKARKLSALKSFYKYITVKKGLMEASPAANIETPKKKKSLPKHLTLEESISLLDAVRSDEKSKTRERDFCMITLFLNTGMRLSELAGISLEDMDSELRSLRVIGKGNKERIIYLNDACRAALSEYLPIRVAWPVKDKNERALFLSSQNKRISIKTIQWVVYKYLKAAGLEYKHFSTHKLRHTAATLMYASGKVDVRVLKEILGHEQLNTTQIYTHVSNKGMERAAAENPLASYSYSGGSRRTLRRVALRTPPKAEKTEETKEKVK
ncbi:MAG: tyrosine recombinase XerC [Eubacteriales bacterium]|jgi:integrase/recombinase XerC|nr:tyrosine recombinase XerC [Clostridiales bacterium]